MKKTIKKAVCLIAVLGVTACATNQNIYYWNNYSETAYQYRHEPSEKTRAKHKASLLEIVSKAEQKKKRVPPGIYAELGLMEAETDNLQQAEQYLLLEKALFPESSKLVDMMLNNIKKAA
jgi:hypothetical protein